MKINITKFHRGDHTIWGQSLLFWEIDFDYDFTNLFKSIENDSSWDPELHIPGRNSLNLAQGKLNEFKKEFQNLNETLIEDLWNTAGNDLNLVLYKGKDFYKRNTGMGTQIYKDLPGFSMGGHLDNNHILFQIIVNVTENETGTRILKPILRDGDLLETEYVMTGEKNKGVIFFNNIMSPHDINGITRDRYILYSSITMNNIT